MEASPKVEDIVDEETRIKKVLDRAIAREIPKIRETLNEIR